MNKNNDLKKFVKSVLSYWLIIFVFAILGFFLALFFYSKRNISYQYTVPIFIKTKINLPQIPISQNVYFNPPVRDPTDTVMAIFQTADIKKISTQHKIEVRKIAPQVIRVMIINSKPKNLEVIGEVIIREVNHRLFELTNDSDTQFSLERLNQPTISTNQVSAYLYLLTGALIGMVIGLSMVFVRIYFKTD